MTRFSLSCLVALLLGSFSVIAQNLPDRLEVHAQTTVTYQDKPKWNAPYTGDNSLTTDHESKTSVTSTLFAGYRLWKNAGLYFNPEIAGGSGISQVLGLGDATNGETFRIGNPTPQVYVARLFFTQKFAIGNETEELDQDFNQLSGTSPKNYFAITVGKVCLTDYLDKNKFSHDPRTQFLCWGLMANGAWDYAANTRGYTPSVVAEYVNHQHELRASFSLLPKLANGNIMNWDFQKANSLTVEYTHNHQWKGREGAIRLLTFYNTANMGNYAEAIQQSPVNPDITAVRVYGHHKLGFGINAEQDLTENMGLFFRGSWNDGKNETWAFTEIDRSVSAGISIKGTKWNRPNDTFGIAEVNSGLSKGHRDYLAAGGKAFMLGDGKLNYAWEHLAETYYSYELESKRLYMTLAYQAIINPGYNADRKGPVSVFSVRLHANI